MQAHRGPASARRRARAAHRPSAAATASAADPHDNRRSASARPATRRPNNIPSMCPKQEASMPDAVLAAVFARSIIRGRNSGPGSNFFFARLRCPRNSSLAPFYGEREMSTLVARLSEYAAGLRYEDLPADVVRQTKRLIIDTLGCALGG